MYIAISTSPDIRSYLQEIRYKFTIEEAAYLVWAVP